MLRPGVLQPLARRGLLVFARPALETTCLRASWNKEGPALLGL